MTLTYFELPLPLEKTVYPITAVAHGVNCQGIMGAGVARAVRDAYGDDMFDSYKQACETSQLRPGGVHLWRSEGCPWDRPDLLNVASQRHPGSDAKIPWLAEGMLKACQLAKLLGHGWLGVPRIGCGIGGLTWQQVEPVLLTASLATDIRIAVFTPKGL